MERSRLDYRDYQRTDPFEPTKTTYPPSQGQYRKRAMHGDDRSSRYAGNGALPIAKSYKRRFNDDAAWTRRSTDDYSPPSTSRMDDESPVNYHHRHSFGSSRFDRQSNSGDVYSSLLSTASSLAGGPSLDSPYYQSSQSASPLGDRRSPVPTSPYVDSARNRYAPPPPSSTTYRSSSPTYRARPISSHSHMQDDYSSSTTRHCLPSYDDVYRTSDPSHRSQAYEQLAPNRNDSSRDYSTTSAYRPDPCRTSSSIPMASSLPLLPSHAVRDQYKQTCVPPREANYHARHYETSSRASSDTDDYRASRHSHDVYRSSAPYRPARPSQRRPRTMLDNPGRPPFKRSMRQ